MSPNTEFGLPKGLAQDGYNKVEREQSSFGWRKRCFRFKFWSAERAFALGDCAGLEMNEMGLLCITERAKKLFILFPYSCGRVLTSASPGLDPIKFRL